MEDASTVQLKLNKDKNSAFFGVFDGHGGPRFAAYCSEQMHKQLLSDPDFGESLTPTSFSSPSQPSVPISVSMSYESRSR